MSFIEKIKYKFKTGNIIEKLVYVNVAIYTLALIIMVIGGLYKVENNFLVEWFSLDDNMNKLLVKPWSIISYGFLHGGFIHLIFNMIALYFLGSLFIQYFTQKQALNFYILGTIFGGIFYLLSQNYFPLFSGINSTLVGASAGISAIILGITTYIPNYQVKIPLIGFVKLWHLTAIWLAFDFIGLIGPNAGGSFSHLGGSLFGFLYVNQASKKDLNIFNSFVSLIKRKEKPLKTVYKSVKKTTKPKQDASLNQQQIDAILDKISKSGYDTLTKQEKEFLFKQGKN